MGITKSERYLRMINYYLIRAKKNRRDTDMEKYYTLKFLLNDEPKSVYELIELVGEATNRPLDPKDRATYMRFYQFVKRLAKEGLVEEKKGGLEILYTAHHKVKEDLQKAYGSGKLFIMTVKDKEELKETIKEELMNEVTKQTKGLTKALSELDLTIKKQITEIERKLEEITDLTQKLSAESEKTKKDITHLKNAIEELSTEVYNIKVLHSGVLTEIATFLTQKIKMTNLKMELENEPFTRRLLTEQQRKEEQTKSKPRKKLIHVKKKEDDGFEIEL